MDSFKPVEIARLSEGGNVAWRQFFDDHESNMMAGRSFAECSIAERYDCEAGVEWKDRLAAKADGKEYVAGGGSAGATGKKSQSAGKGTRIVGGETQRREGDKSRESSATTMNTMTATNTLTATPSTSTSSLSLPSSSSASAQAPAQAPASTARRAQNEAFFARKGAENAQRSENLPPSQGGKYVGYGSGGGLDDDDTGIGAGRGKGIGGSGVDELLQQDPVATITKGLGWLGNVVGQSVQKVCCEQELSSRRILLVVSLWTGNNHIQNCDLIFEPRD